MFDRVGTSSSVTPGTEAASLTDGIRQIIDNAGILSVSSRELCKPSRDGPSIREGGIKMISELN